MAVTRRKFIQQSAMATAASLLATKLTSAEPVLPMPGKNVDDDTYWKAIKAQWPAMQDRIYLNNATMGPTPYPVLNTVQNALIELSRTGEYGGWEVARKSIADLVGAKESEISLTHNTTEAINVVAWGVPMKKGDEVIMTAQEHVGNALPWLNRMRLHGILVRTFQPATTASENMNRINALVTKKTRVIAVPHIMCTTGTMMPVKEIAKLGRDKGIFTMIDGAHGPGSTVVKVKEIGCDFYASCTHKWLCGPAGTGFLYIREELLDTVQAYWVGGYSDKGWDVTVNPPTFSGYVGTAHRYDFATQSSALYKGVASAIGFMEEIGIEKVERRIRELGKHLQDKLVAMPDKVEMLSPGEEASRGPMIGFRIRNMDYQKFGELATKEHFRIRLVAESGLNSIRISTHVYNTEEQIDKFVDLVSKT
jgi:cysteine desulfurase / selenocysteine lyase